MDPGRPVLLGACVLPNDRRPVLLGAGVLLNDWRPWEPAYALPGPRLREGRGGKALVVLLVLRLLVLLRPYTA